MESLGAQFDRFRHEAFRLELLDQYIVDEEADALRQYRRGVRSPDGALSPSWTERIRSSTRDGRKWRRVHVVSVPLSQYVKFEIARGYVHNAAAGEEIRLFPREEFARMQIPPTGVGDFWLFDDRVLFALDYDAYGAFIGVRCIEDLSVIEKCASMKKSLLEHAQPLSDALKTLKQLPSTI